MKLTVSVIKADVGSVGGHTKPSARMLDTVRGEVAKAIDNGLGADGGKHKATLYRELEAQIRERDQARAKHRARHRDDGGHER
jgi:hypothetical protein